MLDEKTWLAKNHSNSYQMCSTGPRPGLCADHKYFFTPNWSNYVFMDLLAWAKSCYKKRRGTWAVFVLYAGTLIVASSKTSKLNNFEQCSHTFGHIKKKSFSNPPTPFLLCCNQPLGKKLFRLLLILTINHEHLSNNHCLTYFFMSTFFFTLQLIFVLLQETSNPPCLTV